MDQVLVGLVCLGVAGGFIWLFHRSARPGIPSAPHARICGCCGKVLRSGRAPVILTRCPPNDPTCRPLDA